MGLSTTMDMGTWCSSGNGDVCLGGSYSTAGYNRFLSYNFQVTRSRAPLWTQLWRKIKKEKKRIFDCSSSMRFSYDPTTYAQNFDQGLTWADPDDLSRSFSARFAVPSRIFEKDGVLAVS